MWRTAHRSSLQIAARGPDGVSTGILPGGGKLGFSQEATSRPLAAGWAFAHCK